MVPAARSWLAVTLLGEPTFSELDNTAFRDRDLRMSEFAYNQYSNNDQRRAPLLLVCSSVGVDCASTVDAASTLHRPSIIHRIIRQTADIVVR